MKISKVKLEGVEYWKIGRNFFSCSKYSEEKATLAAKILKKCFNCQECHTCISCYNCISCFECVDCQNCFGYEKN